MNRGAWWAIAHGVTKSQIRLSDHTFTFTGGPVVNNLTCNARDRGSIPGPGTKIPLASEQLSPCATTRESVHHNKRF